MKKQYAIRMIANAIYINGRKRSNPAPNGAPSALTAVPYSATRIDVFWTNGSTNEDSFNIYGSTDGVNFSVYDTAVAGSTSQNITGLTAGTNYWFYTTAVKGIESVPSNTVATYTYPTELFDGHTLQWVQFEDMSTITKDLDDNDLTKWADKLGSGRDYVNGAVAPTWTDSGVVMKNLSSMVATFNFAATYTIYFVGKLVEFRAFTYFLGINGAGVKVGASNNLYNYANGTTGATIALTGPALGDLAVFMVGCNKAAFQGFFKIDDGAANTAYVGSTDPASITMLSGGVIGNYQKFTFLEMIVRDQYEYNTETLTNIYNYLVKKKLLTETVSPPVYDIDNMLLSSSGDSYLTTDDEQNYISTE